MPLTTAFRAERGAAERRAPSSALETRPIIKPPDREEAKRPANDCSVAYADDAADSPAVTISQRDSSSRNPLCPLPASLALSSSPWLFLIPPVPRSPSLLSIFHAPPSRRVSLRNDALSLTARMHARAHAHRPRLSHYETRLRGRLRRSRERLESGGPRRFNARQR